METLADIMIQIQVHYIDVKLELRRLKSPETQLFVQANNKEYIKTLHYWPFVIPSQRASNAKSVSISWHHHELLLHNVTHDARVDLTYWGYPAKRAQSAMRKHGG